MSRIHGRLLIVTGIIHTLAALIPGIFGAQFLQFSKVYFFSISPGLAAFPLFGGFINYETFAAFWFFYCGPLLILYGQVIDILEKFHVGINLNVSIPFLIVTLIGVYMIPFSGMTFLLLPQAFYMIYKSRKWMKINKNK